MENKIIWLTGPSGAGKTTLARRFQQDHDCIILDGDEMRQSISTKEGFSREDRKEHNFRVARLAKVLAQQKLVIVSVIAPMEEVRWEISNICNPTWIYIKRTLPEREGHFYEEPENSYVIDHDIFDIEDSYKLLKAKLKMAPIKYSLFIGRWQAPEALHAGHLTLFNKVRQEGGHLLIGIRNTETSKTDPLTVQQRIEFIKQKVPDAEIVVLPDIKEVVYGRKVGYIIRKLELDEQIESISATELRNEIKKD
jgi:tRNA uridine 5-carbamoylmethylation protein Kti12